MTWLAIISLVLAILATAEDLWRRQISNTLSLGGVVVGLIANAVLGGWSGLGDSALGCAVGFGVFFLFFLLGGMGGGDVKLMAGFGAILGYPQIVTAAVLTALTGGLMAVGFLVWTKARRALRGERRDPGERDRKSFLPYAPAISLGVLLSFLSEDSIWTSVS